MTQIKQKTDPVGMYISRYSSHRLITGVGFFCTSVMVNSVTVRLHRTSIANKRKYDAVVYMFWCCIF